VADVRQASTLFTRYSTVSFVGTFFIIVSNPAQLSSITMLPSSCAYVVLHTCVMPNFQPQLVRHKEHRRYSTVSSASPRSSQRIWHNRDITHTLAVTHARILHVGRFIN